MFARAVSSCFVSSILLLFPFHSSLGQQLHLKAGSNPLGRTSNRPGMYGQRHLILQFDHVPNSSDLNAIVTTGAFVVAALPDQALMVSVPRDLDVSSSIGRISGVISSGALDGTNKLSPGLLKDGWNAVVVEFHADIPTGVQDEIAAQEGFSLARRPWLQTGHALAYGNYDSLVGLAVHDEVAYIFPADPALSWGGNIHSCAGMLTQNGPVGQYSNIVHGWDLSSDQMAHLTYVFAEMSSRLPALQTQAEIVRALRQWSQVTNVVFQPGTNAAAPKNILIRFVSGAHGDTYPFDGPGGTLAHTFYPVPVNSEPIAGDMHLDADENWHIGADIDLYSVALHEAGHALGLGHSDNPKDVMYPYYRFGVALSANDIGAVQSLYGFPTGSAAMTSSASASTSAATASTPSPTTTNKTSITTTSTTASAPTPAGSVPLVLTVNPVPASVTLPSLTLTGTVSGGTAPLSITWQSGSGSGKAPISGTGAWSAQNLTLHTGANVTTVSVMDAAHHSVTKSVYLTLTANSSAPSQNPLLISIQSPSSALVTSAASAATLSGIVSAGSGVTAITWRSLTGQGGSVPVASGRWTINNVPLFIGNNTILVQVTDSAGGTAWSSVVIVHH